MSRKGYSNRHYQRLSNGGPDTPEQVAERIAYRKAAEQANREMLEKFFVLTPESINDATAWQAARIKELLPSFLDAAHDAAAVAVKPRKGSR